MAKGRIRRRRQGRPIKGAPTVGRDKLVAAMRQLMRTMRPDQITRLDVSRAAGVDPALIRYYFGDKSALADEAVLQAGAELRARTSKSYAEGTSARERIRQRIFVLLETLYADPSLHHLIIEHIIHNKSEQARGIREEFIYRSCDELAAVIKEGVASGELLNVNPRHLFLATVGACSFPMGERALFSELMGGPTTDRDLRAYAQFVSDVFLDGLVTRTPEPKRKRASRRPVS